tara:strand:- start:277 stop:426 length:150 start_codon:yes stop_codon:yes gene_type:complete
MIGYTGILFLARYSSLLKRENNGVSWHNQGRDHGDIQGVTLLDYTVQLG